MQNNQQSFLKLMMLLPGNLMLKILGQRTSLSHPNEYKCQSCNQIKPLTKEYYQSVSKFKFGFSTYCNECDKKIFKKNEKKT